MVLETLREEGTDFRYERELEGAVSRALDGAEPDDLVLLLSALDRTASLVRAVLDAPGVRAADPAGRPPRRRTR